MSNFPGFFNRTACTGIHTPPPKSPQRSVSAKQLPTAPKTQSPQTLPADPSARAQKAQSALKQTEQKSAKIQLSGLFGGLMATAAKAAGSGAGQGLEACQQAVDASKVRGEELSALSGDVRAEINSNVQAIQQFADDLSQETDWATKQAKWTPTQVAQIKQKLLTHVQKLAGLADDLSSPEHLRKSNDPQIQKILAQSPDGDIDMEALEDYADSRMDDMDNLLERAPENPAEFLPHEEPHGVASSGDSQDRSDGEPQHNLMDTMLELREKIAASGNERDLKTLDTLIGHLEEHADAALEKIHDILDEGGGDDDLPANAQRVMQALGMATKSAAGPLSSADRQGVFALKGLNSAYEKLRALDNPHAEPTTMSLYARAQAKLNRVNNVLKLCTGRRSEQFQAGLSLSGDVLQKVSDALPPGINPMAVYGPMLSVYSEAIGVAQKFADQIQPHADRIELFYLSQKYDVPLPQSASGYIDFGN